MNIEHLKIDVLKPNKQNPKIHSDLQISQIANSITEFGFTQPIVVDENFTILVGHGRFAAAKKLEMSLVPVVILRDLSETQKKALLIIDNQLNLETGFNATLMEEQLSFLADSSFDMESLGLFYEKLGEEISEDKDSTKAAKEIYDTADIKQMVLYFLPDEYQEIIERINKIIKKDEKLSELVLRMIENYNLSKHV